MIADSIQECIKVLYSVQSSCTRRTVQIANNNMRAISLRNGSHTKDIMDKDGIIHLPLYMAELL